MLLTEYNYDTDIAVQRQEAYEDGIEQGITQGIAQGIQQGSQQKAIETARKMFLKNIPIDIIAECTGLSIEEVSKLTTN